MGYSKLSALIAIAVFFTQINSMVFGQKLQKNPEYLKYGSSGTVSRCDSVLMKYSGSPDSIMHAGYNQLEVKDTASTTISEREYLLIILGCLKYGEIAIVDTSAKLDKIRARVDILLPGYHAVFGKKLDINKDNIPEIQINLSAGAHGYYSCFLSLNLDSLNFLTYDNGQYLFYAMRGGITVEDENEDGFYEIRVSEEMNVTLKGTKGTETIYKLDGSSYKIDRIIEK